MHSSLSSEKLCARCERTLGRDEFSKNRRRRDGLQTYCRACMTEVRKDWYQRKGKSQQERNRGYQKRNAQHLWDYLLGHPCVDCGERDPVVLEFDHVRGDKVSALSNMARSYYSLAAIDAEIAKCEVRCANCHKRKTACEQGWHVHITTRT